MPNAPKILCFAGSLRKDSFNKKLVKVAMEGARNAGAEVTYVDLKDYPMPIYDGDIEAAEGLPENAKKFKKLMLDHQGFLIACPEYNSSITAVLKNVIDWASRPEPGEKQLAAFTGKVCGLIAASPGALGGLRGLVTVRSIFGNIGVLVLPEQVAVGKAMDAFNEDGSMKDAKQKDSVQNVAKRVAEVAKAIAAVS
jgi:chromate reductase